MPQIELTVSASQLGSSAGLRGQLSGLCSVVGIAIINKTFCDTDIRQVTVDLLVQQHRQEVLLVQAY